MPAGALFVGRKRMGATILRWLTTIVHLVWKQFVIPAQAGAVDDPRSISVPLPTHCRRREIPAFAGMTAKGRRAVRREGLGSAAAPSTVIHRNLRWYRCRSHAPEPRFGRICAELSEPFAPASRTRDHYRVSGGMGNGKEVSKMVLADIRAAAAHCRGDGAFSARIHQSRFG